MKNYHLSDDVLRRIVQIIQEAMLMGVDCVDLLRLIELETSGDSKHLVLSEQYKKSIDEMHAKWLETANKLLDSKTSETTTDKSVN